MYFCSRFSFVLSFVLEAMASVNYAARAQNAMIDRFNRLIASLQAVHRHLRRAQHRLGELNTAGLRDEHMHLRRAQRMLEQELDGVLSDTDSDDAAEQCDEAEQPADMPASGWMLQWYEQLPHGPCRRAVAAMLAVPNDEQSLLDAFAYAQQHYPEEIVLWTLAGSVVPDPWVNASVQQGVRSSLLALRNLRSAPPGIQPFSGVGHQLN